MHFPIAPCSSIKDTAKERANFVGEVHSFIAHLSLTKSALILFLQLGKQLVRAVKGDCYVTAHDDYNL